MKIKIRRTVKSDLKSLLSLYNGKKSLDEINWVLKDFNGEGFRSFVALNDKDKVIGHIGYMTSKYNINGLVLNGMHNMMWIVDKEARGGAGLKLFSKNVKMGDFGFAIGASKYTRKLFPLVKYQYHFEIYQYYKLINPIFCPKFIRGNIKIEKVDNFNFLFDYKNINKNVFYNLPSNEHLNWILDCPIVQATGFKIKENGKTIGIAIVYIKTRFQFIRTGRVVHISFLGEDENKWTQTINLINKYFFERKCYLIFFPASFSKLVNGLLKCGYKNSLYLSKPLYIDNSKNNLPKIEKDNFHLTFLESDLGYRSF